MTPPLSCRDRIQDNFTKQQVMQTLGATLGHVEEGLVEIEAPYAEHLTQQDGFLHAGIVTTLIDSACGYAAYTLMPPENRVLSVEFKVNLLAPSKGQRFLARGKVVKSGRTLTICTGELIAFDKDQPQTVALMQATMISLAPSPKAHPTHTKGS